MSSPPRLKDEIFISYAHADNLTLPGHEKGWVSVFDDALRALLSGKISPVPKVWRDIELGKTEVLDEALLERVAGMAVMISVLSPRYLDSEWCMREVQRFCDAARAKRISLHVAGRSRLVKVVKYPLDQDPPAALGETVGFDFFQIEPNNILMEFRVEFGPDASQKFLRKVNELADEIKSLVQAIKQDSAAADEGDAAAAESPAAVVYLAATTPDLEEARGNIKSDLVQRNIRVLPDRPLPLMAADFREQVRADLTRSSLSIHLIGEEYGSCPVGENRSFVELQHELAADRCATDPDFSRLVWAPVKPDADKTRPEDLRSRRFRDALEAGLGGNAELLQKSLLENFKTLIQDKLNPARKQGVPASVGTGDAPLVFVICDASDAAGARRLYDSLNDHWGCDATLPATGADEVRLREDFQGKLMVCDAVVIYWDRAPESWVQTKLWELQRVRAKRGGQPFLAEAVYLAGERTAEKAGFRTRRAMLVESYGEAAPDALGAFIEAIQQKRSEQAS